MAYNPFCYPMAYNCSSGCCSLTGFCAMQPSDCSYPYSDYNTNPSRYSYNNYNHGPTSTVTDIGSIAGGIAGGMFFFIVFIIAIYCWRKKQAEMNNPMYTNAGDANTVIISTNPNQKTYGLAQPYNTPVMQQPYQQTYPPVYQQKPFQHQQSYQGNPNAYFQQPYQGNPNTYSQQPIIIQNM